MGPSQQTKVPGFRAVFPPSGGKMPLASKIPFGGPMSLPSRLSWMSLSLGLALGFFLSSPLPAAEAPATLPAASAAKLPRWRGFNLLNRFNLDWSNKPFEEEDFK